MVGLDGTLAGDGIILGDGAPEPAPFLPIWRAACRGSGGTAGGAAQGIVAAVNYWVEEARSARHESGGWRIGPLAVKAGWAGNLDVGPTGRPSAAANAECV